MADGVDIDLYDNLEDGFDQDNEFTADDDLYNDVITATSSGEGAEVRFPSRVNTHRGDGDIGGKTSVSVPSGYTGRRISLYVGNLTWWTTDQDLTDSLASIGVNDLVEIKFYENRANGQSKGFAVVVVGSDSSSRLIFEKLPKKELHGQVPQISHCNRQALSQFEAQARKGEPPAQNGNAKPPPKGPSPTQQRMPPRPGSAPRNPRPPGPIVSGPPPGGPPPPGPPHLGPPRPGMPPVSGPPPQMHLPPGMPPRAPGPPPPGAPMMRGPPPPMRGPPPPDPRGPPPRPEWDRPPATFEQPPPPGTPFPPGGPPMGPQPVPPPGARPPGPGMPPQQPPMSLPPPGHPPAPAPHVNPAFFPLQHSQPPPAGPLPTHPAPGPHDPYRGPPPPVSYPSDHYSRPPPDRYVPDSYSRPPERVEPASPALSEQEFEEIFQRNKTVSSSAISRAVQDASAGEFASAIETLVTAISLIKQSKIASDDRCKILISSLQDTLHGIEEKSYGSKSSTRRSRSRERGDRERKERSRSHRSRSREREREYRDRSRERDRHYDVESSSSSSRSHRDRDRDREREREYSSRRH